MPKRNKPYCILIVEDNPGDYFLLYENLKQSQLPIDKVIHAERMQAVPALIKENIFDIVLLDLTLPDSIGVESVIAMGEMLPQAPIVVFSGLSTIEIAVESIALGAQDYLIKGEYDDKLLVKSLQYSIERKRTSETIRESNERYEFVNKATQDTIWEWDYNTGGGAWGNGIIKTFGYPTEELKYDENWIYKFIHPDDAEKVIKKIDYHLINKIENWQEEFRFRCKDGSYREVFDRGFIIYDIKGKPSKMYGAMTDITEHRKLEKKLAAQQLHQQKLITETTIDAQEKERTLLGNELHDNINQILATVKMYISIAMKGDGDRSDLITESYNYLNDAMEEIRKLSKNLVSPSLGDITLEEAIEELVEGINIAKGVRVELKYESSEKQCLDKKIELMIYRIVQEQLNNIQKHAKASLAYISIKIAGGRVFLSITDNGVGFDPALKAKGIGLKNIKNRADFYSGELKIISSPGNGATLEVKVPLKDNNYE